MSAAGASGASFKQAFDQVSGHSPTKTGGSQLNYLAEALGLPHTQWLWQAQPTSRWRALGSPDQLALQATAPHALHRLHIARAALDHAPDGRWALRLPRDAAAGLLGPQAAADGSAAELDIRALIASWPRPLLLRRLFVWLDSQRVDALLTKRWAGARRDLPLDERKRDKCSRRRAIDKARNDCMTRNKFARAETITGLAAPSESTRVESSSPAAPGH